MKGRYDQPIDRESAYEVLATRRTPSPRCRAGACTAGKRVRRRRHGRADSRQPAVQFDGEERQRQAANQLSRELVRGLLGSLMGGKKRR
ncbi:DUF853 family protein [Pseudomonas aeruginosa]|nr:DUF853 family protein [Pseudomonas aeruginosa]